VNLIPQFLLENLTIDSDETLMELNVHYLAVSAAAVIVIPK